MKALCIVAALAGCMMTAEAQSVGDVVKQNAAEGAKQGAEVATEQTANKVTSALLNKLTHKKNKQARADSARPAATGVPVTGSPGGAAGLNGQAMTATTGSVPAGSAHAGSTPAGSGDWKTYSKFDFVPGEKILVVEDFDQDAAGDFPDKWNTNSTGEVQTVAGKDGKWLSVTKRGVFLPEFITALPDNFTLQFELLCSPNFSRGSGNFSVSFNEMANPAKDFARLGRGAPRNGPMLFFQPNAAFNHGFSGFSVFMDDDQVTSNQADDLDWVGTLPQKNVVRVSIWRQKTRLRVYMNEEKVWDLPRAFDAAKKYNSLLFGLTDDLNPGDRMLVGNLRLAVGAADTRNKLLTEGKFSTTGILFDVNSAILRPESSGVLKEIADVLNDDAALKLMIVGHTDSDGDGATNVALSKRRADAVKDALMKEFGIDASRLQTDGKGATQPVAPNDAAVGKALNRRVEFIRTAG